MFVIHWHRSMSGVYVEGGYDNELFWPCLVVKFSIHSLIMLEECSKLLWKTTMTPANSLSLLASSESDKNLLDEASASAQPENALFVRFFNFWSQTFPLHHRLHKLTLSHLKMKPFCCWIFIIFILRNEEKFETHLSAPFDIPPVEQTLCSLAGWAGQQNYQHFLPKSQKRPLW